MNMPNISRPPILGTCFQTGDGCLCDLAIQLGDDPGPIVKAEFLEISKKHELTATQPQGGLYDVQAIDPVTGRTKTFLDGMYVHSKKLSAVLADLTERNYPVIIKQPCP